MFISPVLKVFYTEVIIRSHNYGIRLIVLGFSWNILLHLFMNSFVFTAKRYKLTPWQFITSGDWLREHKYQHKKEEVVFFHYTVIFGLMVMPYDIEYLAF